MINSYTIDKKLEPVLRSMENVGVKIDVKFLDAINQKTSLKLAEIENKIYGLTDHKFNLNSPKQLAEILYQKLRIVPQKSGIKRRKSHHSTAAADLAKIQHLHPVVDLILNYRELSKLKNTYLDTLGAMVDKKNRLHTHYRMDTATGRLSSREPNLQNIPNRGESGAEIRKVFVAPDEGIFLVADYSQIELRIAAHFSQDPVMLKAFQSGEDIHRATAQELGIDRKTAKTVNFSILYGVSAYGLAETLEIPPEEAQILIDKYFLAFKGLKKYINEVIDQARRDGFVTTLFGRKRMVPELLSPYERVRCFGERVVVNTPFQGTAAEIIKLAMIEINHQLSSVSYQSSAKLILQVHDELVFETKSADVRKAAKMVQETMENVVKLRVPLIVDLKIGKNWGELEKLEV